MVLLQEVWHSPDDFINIRNFNKPIIKLRNGRQGGGVAIITHNRIKTVYMKQYEVDGLEAVWAEIMCGKIRVIIGSVYIPPNDCKALELFDSVITNITRSHKHVIIGMDANARNLLWDNECVGASQYHMSMKMENILENIVDRHCMYVHNDGTATYHSGNYASTPDVTISIGLSSCGNINWSVITDELKSPHDGILLEFGSEVKQIRREVIDWKNVDWTTYRDLTGNALYDLHDKWMCADDVDVNEIADELNDKIHECVHKVAINKIVTKYSRPWIDKDISDKLKELRKLKRKCRLGRSRANLHEYRKMQKGVVDVIQTAEDEWLAAECEKLSTATESEKWKLINKLTNQSNMVVQPIVKDCNGLQEFMFSDDDICHELEQYHICKSQFLPTCDQTTEDAIREAVSEMVREARNNCITGKGCESDIMNADVTDHEVSRTFSKGSDTPGHHGISANLIDNADREQMHRCLKFLWNTAWCKGHFANEWKKENRVVLPKPGKDCYNECCAYRTVSITPCVGKRFELITSKRLSTFLAMCKFDVNQFAYLHNRSTTQSLLMVVEKVKKSLLCDEFAGAVFFDFIDAFGSVNRDHLLLKIGRDFNITGRLFLHIASFLEGRLARIKFSDKVGE